MSFQKIQENKIFEVKKKKDFNNMIQAISNIAALNKIDIKKYNYNQIINFTKKYSLDINKEYKNIEKNKENKCKN